MTERRLEHRLGRDASACCWSATRSTRLDEWGEPIIGDSFLVLLNASGNAVDFTLPAALIARPLEVVLDTFDPSRTLVEPSVPYALMDHSAVVIRVR